MPDYAAPLADIDFVLNQVIDLPAVAKLDGFQHADPDTVRGVLAEARWKLTRPEILGEWPPDEEKPDSGTLWRWLERAVAAGLVQRDGSGRKRRPYRYWLAEREAQWRQSPFYRDQEFLEELGRQQEEDEAFFLPGPRGD